MRLVATRAHDIPMAAAGRSGATSYLWPQPRAEPTVRRPLAPRHPVIRPINLATMNPRTGQVTAVRTDGAPYVPQGGLTFLLGYW
jgi:hypothetical protein